MRHVNIPVFIPHLGCPHDCVFCNQRVISGQRDFDPDSLEGIIDEALATVSPDDDVEVAFFGGSFTGIDRELMISLLSRTEPYIKSGRVSRLRCSTRPDYISDEILDILARYSMETVELGMQSLSDDVLSASFRGHTAGDTLRASELILKHGMRLAGQMMIGLPHSTANLELETARAICGMGCCEARVYPTIVFEKTALAAMMRRGEYTPLTVEDAAKRCADVLHVFDEHGVHVLRVGLCDGEGLHSAECVGGPVHPAMGELSRSVIFRENIAHELEKSDFRGASVTVLVPRGAVSAAVGNRGENRRFFMSEYGIKHIKFREDESLRGYEAKVTREVICAADFT